MRTKKIDDTCPRVSAIFLSRNLAIRDEEQNKIMSRVIVQLVRLKVDIYVANFLQIYRLYKSNAIFTVNRLKFIGVFLIRREIKANEKLVIVQIRRSPGKLDDELPVI